MPKIQNKKLVTAQEDQQFITGPSVTGWLKPRMISESDDR